MFYLLIKYDIVTFFEIRNQITNLSMVPCHQDNFQNKFWYFYSLLIDIDIPQIYPIVKQNVTHFTRWKHDRKAQSLE